MKLHLPKMLRRALLACVAAVAGVTTTAGTATVVGGVVTYAMLNSQVLAGEYTVNTSASPANGDAEAPANNINTYTAEDTLIFDLNRGYLKMENLTINAQVVINQLRLDNGSGNKTYTFANTVTGTGEFSYVAVSTAKNQTYHFQGSMAGYSGNMTLKNDRESKFIFSAESGTGTITALGTNRVVVDGATILNSSIDTALLEVTNLGSTESAAITTVGSDAITSTVKASAVTIAANSGLHVLAGSALSLGSAVANAGALTLDGTLAVETLDGWGYESTGSLSNGTHGYRSGELIYTLITSSGDAASLELGEGFAFMVGDVAVDSSAMVQEGGTLKYVQSGASTLYEISSEYNGATPVTYAGSTGDMEQATGFRLANGTTLRLTSSLADSMVDGIKVASGAAVTVEVQNSGDTETVLQADSLNLAAGSSVVLKGNGVYRNDAVTNVVDTVLPAGVTYSADGWTGVTELAGGADGLHLGNALNKVTTGGIRLNGLIAHAHDHTVAKSMELVNGDGVSALKLQNGSSQNNQTSTFQGAISGTGDMEYNWSSGNANICSTHVFSGSVSAWDGWFISGTSAAKMVEAKFTSGGEVFSTAGNGGVKDNRTSDYHLKVTIEAESDTTFNGSIVNAKSVAVNSNTVFKKNINAVSMTVADGVDVVLDNGSVVELDTLAGAVSSNGGTIILGSVAAETSATIGGSSVTIADTISNEGTLDITATSIMLGADMSAYAVKQAGTSDYSLDGENIADDDKQNGFRINRGDSIYLIQGDDVSVAATHVQFGDLEYELVTDSTGVWFVNDSSVMGKVYFVTTGDVVVDLGIQEKANGYALNGGVMKVTEGQISATRIDASSVTTDGAVTAGGISLSGNAVMTDLDPTLHGAVLGCISGTGTLEITSADNWGTVINTMANSGEGDLFTGTAYVKSGKFTYDGEKLGSTLILAENVHFQVNASGDMSHDLVLEAGNHEVHVNGENVLNITGSISGEGVFNKHAGGTVNVLDGVQIANYKNSVGTTNIGAATVSTLALNGGAVHVNGGTVSLLDVAAGTANVTAGAVTSANVTEGTLNVSGGTVNAVESTGVVSIADGQVKALTILEGSLNMAGGNVTTLTMNGGSVTVLGGTVGNLEYTGGSIATANDQETGVLKVTGVLTVADSSVLEIGGAGAAEIGSLKLQTGSLLDASGALTLGTIEFTGVGAAASIATLAGAETEVLLDGLLDTVGELDKTVLMSLAESSDCNLLYNGSVITAEGITVSRLDIDVQRDYKLALVGNELTLEFTGLTHIQSWGKDEFGEEGDGSWDSGVTDDSVVKFDGAGSSTVTVDAAGVSSLGIVVAGSDYTFVGGDVSVSGDMLLSDGGSLTVQNHVTVDKNATVAKDATLVVEAGAEVEVGRHLNAQGAVQNYGVLSAASASVGSSMVNDASAELKITDKLSAGSLSNAGLIEAGTLAAAGVANSGTLTADAVQVDKALANIGSIGAGSISAASVDNSGNIEAASISASNLTNSGEIYVSEKLATDKLTIDYPLSVDGEVQIQAASIAALSSGGNVIIDLTSQALAPIQEGDYALLKVGGDSVTLDGNSVESGLALSNAVIEYFKQKNQKISLIGAADQVRTFALRDAAASLLTISLNVRELTEADKYWNTSSLTDGLGMTLGERGENGSIVLFNNSVLDDISSVYVDAATTIDLTSKDDAPLNINSLSGSSSLSLVGNGDTANFNGGSLDAKLVLKNVKASMDGLSVAAVQGDADSTLSGTLELTGTGSSFYGKYHGATVTIVNGTHTLKADGGLTVNGSAGTAVLLAGKGSTLGTTGTDVVAQDGVVSLVGSMVGGKLTMNAGLDTSRLLLTGTDVDVALSASADNNQAMDVATGSEVVITSLGAAGSKVGEVDLTINGSAFDLESKYFERDSIRLVGGKLMASRNASYYSDKAGEGVSASGAAGLALADAALVGLNPQLDKTSDLGAVLNLLDNAGAESADKLGASLAGASTAVLGMAAMGDVERQLKAIRNRTTTMGVDQSVANEDMPYVNAWINAEGNRSELSDSESLAGYELNSWGGTVGFDVDICPTLTAGVALTAMRGDLDATGVDTATGDMDTNYMSVFARYATGAWTHTFVATVGMSDISLNRTVSGVELEGKTDATSFGFMYEVGHVIALDEECTACLQPVFNVTWRSTSVDGYSEEGSDLALKVEGQSLNTVTFGLGARLQAVVGESMYNRSSILEARVLAKVDAGDRSGSSDVALAALPEAKSSVDSAEMGAFGLEMGAGLTLPLGQDGGSVFVDASVELRSDYTNVNGTVGYRINF